MPSFFEPKSCWKNDIYWLMKSSFLELFGDGKYGHFWAKKLTKRWYLLIAEKFLFWTFWGWNIWSFFEPKSWWKDDIYWLLESSCFELSGDRKYGLFLSQIVDGKTIFTDYWKVLLWKFLRWKIRSFLEPKSWWRNYI